MTGRFTTILTGSPAGRLSPLDDGDKKLSLTEALVKPLHRFSEPELEGLVRELYDSGYLQRERAIQAAADGVAQAWVTDQQHGSQGYYPNRSSVYSFTVDFYAEPSAPMAQTHIYRVVIPAWLPPEMVRPVAERMIRDQLEEG